MRSFFYALNSVLNRTAVWENYFLKNWDKRKKMKQNDGKLTIVKKNCGNRARY